MSQTHPDLTSLVEFAHHLADLARAETLPRFRGGAAVYEKQGPIFDPVTDADREAERVIREAIEGAHPDHGILGEEHGEKRAEGPWRWVLDPIDGTRSFMCGVPTWTTLIGLEFDGRPVLGLIDQAYTGERWVGTAEATHHLHHGGSPLRCKTSGVTSLDSARIATTDPRATAYFDEREAEAFARLSAASRLARFSLDGYAYALLASGELDVVAEAGLHVHDYVALISVVEGAGGVLTNWRGEPVGSDPRGEALAAATPELHAAAVAQLQGHSTVNA